MYETHFGLNKRPFPALAEGSAVFVGPQAAATMAALKKALVGPDTVVAVSGPAGVGKTTVVRRALTGVGGTPRIISIGRIQLGHDEVLEMLLEEMRVTAPTGTVQRFTALRRHFKEFEDQGCNVIVVVEDAARVGVDALSELEALTAADAGVSGGARVVLMGDESMNETLQSPRLARLKQRLRLRQVITPLSSNELMAYLKHCFRLAGNEFDTVFEHGSADLLHQLSGGVVRMANGLVESCLISAAENKQKTVSVALIRQIAIDEYALDVDLPEPAVAVAPVEVAKPVIAPQPEPAPAPPEPEPQPVMAKIEDTVVEEPIPELIQDTLPDLAILAPALAQAAMDDNPTSSGDDDSENDAVPEWERDPTLAQLRPDLDALEHAMAVAQGLEPDDEEEVEQQAEENIPELVPEITLDRAIQAKIDEATEELKKAEREAAAQAEEKADEPVREPATPAAKKTVPDVAAASKPQPQPVPESKPEPVKEKPVVERPTVAKPVAPITVEVDAAAQVENKKADAELEKIAMNLARAKTIDDCDDQMAETLFGDEFSAMAAQVAANAPSELSANDSMELELEKSAAFQVADFAGSAARNVESGSESSATPAKLDPSASQRLATVRALNATPGGPSPDVEAVAMGHYEARPAARADSPQPESIEEQINTSITQTLKALSVRPPQPAGDDDDERKSGFFSRFRRS
ncbi:MAG: hypothetical protein OEM25_02200 [Gammaproteobacteria bacterium]|nr:hypothetical protein [Gammaproteobacteria bacterium]